MSINSNQLTKKIRTILDDARQQDTPFVVAWRPQKDASHLHAEYDAGCGCGPVDFGPIRQK